MPGAEQVIDPAAQLRVWRDAQPFALATHPAAIGQSDGQLDAAVAGIAAENLAERFQHALAVAAFF